MSETASRALPVQDARIYPRGGLDVLSRAEVARLRDASAGGMHELLRRCALAVLTSGSASDDPRAARGSSDALPLVSTASAQRRSSSCMPPLEASRRRATSARESTSRPPRG